MNQAAAAPVMVLRHQQALSPQATNQCRHAIHKVKNLTAVDLLDKFCFVTSVVKFQDGFVRIWVPIFLEKKGNPIFRLNSVCLMFCCL